MGYALSVETYGKTESCAVASLEAWLLAKGYKVTRVRYFDECYEFDIERYGSYLVVLKSVKAFDSTIIHASLGEHQN